MKLLFDQNLPPRLERGLADLFPDSKHAHSLDLDRATDREIADFAQRHGFAVVTKDKDFGSIASGSSLKVIWIRRGNCRAEDVLRLMREQAATVSAFGEGQKVGPLELY